MENADSRQRKTELDDATSAGFFERRKNASKWLTRLPQNMSIFASRRRKFKGKGVKAFYLAKSTDEMLKAFQKMESHFDDKDLGFELWILAVKLYEERQDTENMLCYGKRALKFAIDWHNTIGSYVSSLMIPNILNVLGYACCKLSRYGESLSYLNWGVRNLNVMESAKSYPAEFILSCLHGVHFELAIVKTAMGRGEEVVVHMRKILEIQDKRKAGGSIDQAIEKVVNGVKGLGRSEQAKVDGAVRLLNEMKENVCLGDSPENVAFKMERD